MKFLVDAQLPPDLAKWLRARGHEAAAVREIGLREASDREIWDYAVASQTVIITKDEDFALLANRHAAATVMWVRYGNLSNRVLLARLDAVWTQAEAHLDSGLTLIELV